mgnify:FL=1
MKRFTVDTIRAFVPDERRAYECALVFPDVFTERQCNSILARAGGLDTDDARIGDGLAETAPDDAIRRSRTAWISADESSNWIYDKLATVAGRANRTYDFDLIGFTEPLQYTVYDRAGAFYTWHQDGLDGELAIRKLSLVVQLSDPEGYEGSDLEFFGDDDAAEDDAADWRTKLRRRGSVIAFPAFEYHRVTPLASGERHSLVCWVGGPRFR